MTTEGRGMTVIKWTMPPLSFILLISLFCIFYERFGLWGLCFGPLLFFLFEQFAFVLFNHSLIFGRLFFVYLDGRV
jgi:hypothetical protein